MNPNFRNFALWVVIFLLVIALVTLFNNPGQRSSSLDMSYSTLLQEAQAGRVSQVTIAGPEVSGTTTDGRNFTTYVPPTIRPSWRRCARRASRFPPVRPPPRATGSCRC